MEIYNLNQRMSLNDARTVLTAAVSLRFLITAGNPDLHDYIANDFCTDVIDLHDEVEADYLENAFGERDEQLIGEMQMIKMIAMAAVVINRALPVTSKHARACQRAFTEAVFVAYQVLELRTDPAFAMVAIFGGTAEKDKTGSKASHLVESRKYLNLDYDDLPSGTTFELDGSITLPGQET